MRWVVRQPPQTYDFLELGEDCGPGPVGVGDVDGDDDDVFGEHVVLARPPGDVAVVVALVKEQSVPGVLSLITDVLHGEHHKNSAE